MKRQLPSLRQRLITVFMLLSIIPVLAIWQYYDMCAVSTIEQNPALFSAADAPFIRLAAVPHQSGDTEAYRIIELETALRSACNRQTVIVKRQRQC